MHIAHIADGEFLSVEQLAKMVGLKRRQIANLARDERIPDVTRPDGYHFQYRLTPELRDWIKRTRRQVEMSRLPKAAKPSPKDKNRGVLSLHGISMEFEIWLRKAGSAAGVLAQPADTRAMFAEQLKPMADLYRRIVERSKDRR